MFSHLFNTYEAVTPPQFKHDAEEKIDTKISPYIADVLNLSSYSLPKVEKPSDKLFIAPQSETFTQEVVQKEYVPQPKPSSDPLLSNQDIKSPERISKGKFDSRDNFIKTLNAGYRKALSKKGLNPDYSYILTAQAALESGWGKHVSGNFNFGGIKAVGDQKGTYKSTKEYDSSKGYYTIKAKFRDFDSIEDYCEARVNLLSNKRYNVFNQFTPDNPQQIMAHVVRKGYATAPVDTYVSSVMGAYKTVINTLIQ